MVIPGAGRFSRWAMSAAVPQVVLELDRYVISWTNNFNLNALRHLYNIDCYDRKASAVC